MIRLDQKLDGFETHILMKERLEICRGISDNKEQVYEFSVEAVTHNIQSGNLA